LFWRCGSGSLPEPGSFPDQNCLQPQQILFRFKDFVRLEVVDCVALFGFDLHFVAGIFAPSIIF
jgi:hypothetical protein